MKNYSFQVSYTPSRPRSSRRTAAAAGVASVAAAPAADVSGKLDKAVFDSMFELVNIGTASAPEYAIRAKYGLYADGFLSAMGLNPSGGGGGGASYDRLDAWGDYTSERAGWVLSAALGYDLHGRVRSLEGGSALSFTDEGAGNVVTAVRKSGTAVTVTKGLTALTSHQPIYALTFQAGAFGAKTYTPNTGAQTVNVPTKTSHLSNDSGFLTSSALTGYATQSWVQGLGYITASALTPYITAAAAEATFATKLGISGSQIGTYVGGKLGNLITVPYAANADKWGGEQLSSFRLRKRYTLDLTSLSESNFYPVVFGPMTAELDCEIRSTSFSASAAYNQNNIHYLLTSQGWSDTPPCFVILSQGNYDDNEITIGAVGRGLREGRTCVWLRGGLTYNFISNSIPALKTSDYTYGSEVYTVGTDLSGGTNKNVSVVWKNDGTRTDSTVALQGGNVASATKLQTARTLWGQTFDGTGNVSGNITGAGLISASGEISTSSPNAFRMTYGNYGAFFRQDGQALYLMLTDSGNQTGTFNAFRPFMVELATGTVKISGSSGLTVTAGGSIGVRTSIPDYPLDVNGAARINGNLYLCSHGQSYFGLGTGDGATWATYNVKLHLHYGMAITDYADNINFLIDARLGNFSAKGTIYATKGIYSDGYMSAKGINTASDARLKRRIADVALTVRDVAEAPVYRFAWLHGGGVDVGSTAQYWAARVPELTHLLQDGIHLGLDYGKAALLSVVSVARATAGHERRIAALERENGMLKSEIERLKKTV